MAAEHRYRVTLDWTGAAKGPAKDYASYSRSFTARIAGKPDLVGSADPAFKGDPAIHNPEDLLVVSLASCHMLSYLALAASSGVTVTAYADEAEGRLEQGADKGWKMVEVVLRPRVTLAPGADQAKAQRLHDRAHDVCFIARSVNFPVKHEAVIVTG